ncbi:hypothetical protein NB037_12475 [Rathayibacter sp. ZW T2_19]|uniref:Uncharacterized protein n=1 Tax=Rathayibacter rubneri TaxID=2950106 RepID=A0A9X2E0M4_9MICO|nr:hypothetical protein [Rathayibacter rubneri]MCM6763233.1 hypothetical protein [Rathayibacter rubneri]
MSFDADDPYPDPPPRVPRPGEREPARLASRIEAVLLLVLLVGLGAGLSFLVLILQMGMDACGGSPGGCDFALLTVTTWIVPAVVGLFAVLTLVAVVRRPTTSRQGWMVPVLGMAAAVAAFLLAGVLVAVALQGVSG